MALGKVGLSSTWQSDRVVDRLGDLPTEPYRFGVLGWWVVANLRRRCAGSC